VHLQRPDAGGQVHDAVEALGLQGLLERVHPHPQAQVENGWATQRPVYLGVFNSLLKDVDTDPPLEPAGSTPDHDPLSTR